jgi:putative spermidine/putrescine transport system ATP-binding protein
MRDQMQEEIKSLHRDLATTIIYVTHDQEEALNMSDRICLMHGGTVAQLGTPEELYFEPASTFVAEFVGESNLFSGTMVDPSTFRAEAGQTFRVADARGIAPGMPARLLVRPEKIRADAEQPEGNHVDGVVESISFVGGLTRVSVRSSAGPHIIFKAVSVRATARVTPGMAVRLGWSPADSVVLVA